jgi:hypothetical protein
VVKKEVKEEGVYIMFWGKEREKSRGKDGEEEEAFSMTA